MGDQEQQVVPRINRAASASISGYYRWGLACANLGAVDAKSSALLVLNRVRSSLAIQGKDLQLPTNRQAGRRIANSFVAGLVLELSCHRNLLPTSQRSKKFPRAIDCDLVNDPKFILEYRNVLMNGLEVQSF